jgi:hypothetical protein
MKKVLMVLGMLVLPSALFAQGALRITSVNGQVEWRAASSRNFVPLTGQMMNQAIQAGDELRTGPDAQLILTAPDSSYMVVSGNSRVVVDDYWSANHKSILHLMLGQVRFYIQRLGGRPSPYSVRTPTALIAVRGTTFEVIVDDAQFAEVRCLEGSVTVETVGLSDREVILSPGYKTFVYPGEAPLTPVLLGADFKNRVIRMQKKNGQELDANGMPSINILANDNDRRNRTSDPMQSNSRTKENTQRAKPGTLSFPR